MLLAGKKLLITGVLTPQSIAFAIAEMAQQQGAEIILTGFGRAMSLTQRSAKRLGINEVLELDVTNPEHFKTVQAELKSRWGRVDGAVHAVAYAPEDALGGNFLNTPYESVATALRVSVFSLKELATCVAPLMTEGGSIITLDFDNTTTAWPIYDWMGVMKAGLTATVRYLARDLGQKKIRVNSIAAGPLATIAAKGIPGFRTLEMRWSEQAPLGWNARTEHASVAKASCAMLSDWFPHTTGDMIHVDGGYHCLGAPRTNMEEEKRLEAEAAKNAPPVVPQE